MMLHLGFESVSHQLDCITNDSWLRCHVLFNVSYHTFLGNIVLSFSHIQLTFPSFAFASVASSPKLFSAPFAAKKALQFSHWPCVRGSQVGWDDDGWDFLKAKHLHPKYPAGNEQRPTLREPYAETGDFIATYLTLVGWLSHPPNKGDWDAPKCLSRKKQFFRNL